MFVCTQVSYTRAQTWVSELQKQEGPGIVIALAGNKADLSDLRAVDADVTVNLSFSILFLSTPFITLGWVKLELHQISSPAVADLGPNLQKILRLWYDNNYVEIMLWQSKDIVTIWSNLQKKSYNNLKIKLQQKLRYNYDHKIDVLNVKQ